MLFDNNDMDFFNLINVDTSDDLNLFSTKEGFLRGNMFEDEYLPYKNMTFLNINPKSDRESKLLNVMQYSFAITDLNLYLDLHPEDKYANKLFKEMVMEAKKAKEEYSKMYGPLSLNEVDGDTFDWINGPWSWEKDGGNMYV